MDDHVQQNFEEAQQSQRRFEFYFVALTFTILALSVRTSPKSVVLVTGIAELTGWLLLGSAGGSGYTS